MIFSFSVYPLLPPYDLFSYRIQHYFVATLQLVAAASESDVGCRTALYMTAERAHNFFLLGYYSFHLLSQSIELFAKSLHAP